MPFWSSATFVLETNFEGKTGSNQGHITAQVSGQTGQLWRPIDNIWKRKQIQNEMIIARHQIVLAFVNGAPYK